MKYAWILAALVVAHGAPGARAQSTVETPQADAPEVAALVEQPAAAPALLGLVVELPFEFRVKWHEESHGGGRSIAAMQRIEGEAIDASGKPVPMALIVSYRSFEGLPSAELERIAQEAADKAGAAEGARGVETFRIDGFSFHFVDGAVDGDDTYGERMTMAGVVSGGYFRFSVFSTEAAMLTPELAARMRAARLDYAALLKLKPRFEEEARMALRDGALDTPLSRLTLDKGAQARLVASLVTRDASGETIRRERDFAIFKAGFWTLQSLTLSVSCGRDDHPGWNADDFLRMTPELEEEDVDDRPVNVSAPAPASMLGLPAQMTTAKGAKVPPVRRTDIRRWLVRHDGMAYGIGLERLNGSPVEKQLVAQFEAAEPRCQLDLQFGDAGIAQ